MKNKNADLNEVLTQERCEEGKHTTAVSQSCFIFLSRPPVCFLEVKKREKKIQRPSCEGFPPRRHVCRARRGEERGGEVR